MSAETGIARAGGWNLLVERLNRGLTQTEVARACGIAIGTLNRIESGRRPGNAAIAKRIADFYDARVTDVWPELAERAAA